MKTTYFKPKWLIPLLGCALVAGGFAAGTIYRDLDRATRAEQAYSSMLDRLDTDHKLSFALKKMHDGNVDAAARHLDLLLCQHVLQTKAEIASADIRKQAYVQDAFAKIARRRPGNAEIAAGTAHELSNDQIAAERILVEACADNTDVDDGLAGLP